MAENFATMVDKERERLRKALEELRAKEEELQAQRATIETELKPSRPMKPLGAEKPGNQKPHPVALVAPVSNQFSNWSPNTRRVLAEVTFSKPWVSKATRLGNNPSATPSQL